MAAIAAAQTLGLKHVLVDEDITFSAASRIPVPSNITLVIDANITNTSTSNSAGMFSIAAGTENVILKGGGELLGPYTASEPVPSGSYTEGNPGNIAVAICGSVEEGYCSNIQVRIPCRGWGQSGVFAECCDDLFVGGAGMRLEKIGRDGVRMYGCRRPKIGHGLHIENIHPGLSGNVYGVTATRRQSTVNSIAEADLNLTTWTGTRLSAAASGVDAYGQTAYLITESVDAGVTHSTQLTPAISANQEVTCSLLAKAGTIDELRFILRDSVDIGNFISVYFDLTTLTAPNTSAGGAATATTADITSVGDGWYRCRLVGRCATAGANNLRWDVFTADGSSTLTGGSGTVRLAGPQAVAGNKEIAPYELVAYPPTTDFQIIGSTVDGCYIWKALDTHGGKRGIISDWVIHNCATAIGVAEGDTSAKDNCPPEDIRIANIYAERGTGSTGSAGINIVGSAATDGARGNGVTVGSKVTLDGFGGTNTGAVECSYFDGINIDNPLLRNSNRAGISFKDGPVQGTARARVENLTGTVVAAIAVETTKANLDLPGGTIRRTTGSMTAFSMVAQDAGYEVTVGNGWKMEGAVTRWGNANDVTDISRASPVHQRIHAAGSVAGGTGTGSSLYGCTTARTAAGVYTITFTTAVSSTALMRAHIEVLGNNANFAQVTKTSTTVLTVNIFDDLAAAADNDFTFEIRAA